MSSYQPPPAPALHEPPGPDPAGAAPRTVRWSAIGVFVLAALNLVGVALSVAIRSRTVDRLKDQTNMSDVNAQAVATITVAVAVVISVGFVALFVWLGVKTLRGRNWARITVTVILALAVISALVSIAQPGTALETALHVLKLVVDAAVLVLLWGTASARGFFARP